MGSPTEEWGRGASSEDQIAVMLTHDFMLSEYEVTQAQWTSFGYKNPAGPLTNGDAGIVGGECSNDPRCPAASVNWFEAAAFANALSTREGLPPCYVLSNCVGNVGEGMKCDGATLTTATTYACLGYRLPTSAEWEYAARAGTRTPFYSGDVTAQASVVSCCNENSLNPVSWYCADSNGWTHPVGEKAPNAWGLYDMLGNVTEWVSDPYTGSTPTGPLVDRGSDLGTQLS